MGYSEIDKYASKAYSAIHNVSEDLNLGDITKINEKELEDCDLITWGFPCQDISCAGKQKGMIDEDGNKTRSGLYYDGLRILKYIKPKYSIIENVKALTQKKFKNEFKQMLEDLNDAGYNNYWKVLNAKDFGIPQSRERVFIINIRKDIDNNRFEFPVKESKLVRLKDVLEDNVDEKYYINQEKTNELLHNLLINDSKLVQVYKNRLKINNDNIIDFIDANYWKGLDNHAARTGILEVGLLNIKGNGQIRRVYSPEGLSPTLNTMQGGNRQPKIIIDDTQGFDGVRGYVDVCPTLRSSRFGLKVIDDNIINSNYRIRKLTPLECWRLMGYSDIDFYKVKDLLNNRFYKGKDRSDSQLYKMAGNSIVVNVLEAIFRKLFKESELNKGYY